MLCALAVGHAGNAFSQPAQPAPTAPPTQPAPATQPAAQPGDELGPGDAAIKDTPDPLAALLAPDPAGLTFEAAATIAVSKSSAVNAKRIELEGANGAVSQTMVSFFPRVTLAASYTRLSEVDSPELGGGGAIVGVATEGPVTVGPCPVDPTTQCVLDSAGLPAQAAAFGLSFDSPLNQIAFSGNITIPISDYFLRAVQAYNGAEANEEALELQVEAQKLVAGRDAKLALIGWALSRGQSVVAAQSVEQAKNVLKDMKASLAADKAAPVDVLRIEALVAQAEFTLAEAKANEFIAEQRLRTILHTPPEQTLTVGIDLFAAPTAPVLPPLEELVKDAIEHRLELLATDKSREALLEVESATRASYYPRLDAFGDVLIANPNQRVFPQQERFDATWSVGARLTWVVNDTFSTIGATAQAEARTAQVEAGKQQLMEAVRLEVVQSHADITKAGVLIEAANRGVIAAEETLRVSKRVFAVGTLTGTGLADQENALTAARLRKLSAFANLQSAMIRLDHATGRDRRAGLAPTR